MNDVLINRFLIKVIKTDSCWIWSGGVVGKGYGVFHIDRKPILAHRFSYIIYKGEIPEKLHCLHICDNPICVNPDHLFLGTNQDNINDKVRKKRQLFGERQSCSKLNNIKVLEIRAKYAMGNYSQRSLAEEYSVHQRRIFEIVNNKRWRHV